jgi:uncharacterized protein with GYD domain
MARYLIQATYTPEAWAAQLKNPQNRRAAATPLVEQLGGHLEAFYYAFGASDLVIIAEAPDNISAAAIGLAVTSTGAFKSYTTTPLLTVDEAMQAMRKAGEAGAAYRPPTA